MLLVATSASATTVVEVGNGVSCTSGPHAAFLITQDGKRISHAHVDVYREIKNGERAVWRGTTDDSGQVKTPGLESGKYRVFVDSAKDSGNIDLTVASDLTTASACELKFAPPPKTEIDILSELAGEAPTITLKTFRGIVQDETNALIPKLRIRVFRKGVFDKSIVETRSADLDSKDIGEFQLSLDKGDYVAFFDQLGFRRRAVAFEIDKDGLSGFKLTMVVSGSSTPNPPPVDWNPGK
jgi:hypothetical protein